MNDFHITNTSKIVEQLARFSSYVQYKDGINEAISFRDCSGFLGREEDYKTGIAEKAREELHFKKWKKEWIGTGNIALFAKAAMKKAGNLVNKNQQIDFINRLNPDHPKYRKEAEQVLFDIYRDPSCDEATAFSHAVRTFGAKYDTIAFLFFIKDDTRFLPISVGHFDKGFSLLDIDHVTSGKCGWNNYQVYIEIIKEIRDIMEDILPMKSTPRLIDAHSFVWIIQQDRFINWMPDAEQAVHIEDMTESIIHDVISKTSVRRKVTSNVYTRSIEVVKAARRRANGICQYCNQPAPFSDKKGEPYLEVHHVIWLSRGGADSTNNTVALCPNCHTRMHVLDDQEDVNKLLNVLKN